MYSLTPAEEIHARIAKLQAEVAARTVRQSFTGSAGLGEQGATNEY